MRKALKFLALRSLNRFDGAGLLVTGALLGAGYYWAILFMAVGPFASVAIEHLANNSTKD